MTSHSLNRRTLLRGMILGAPALALGGTAVRADGLQDRLFSAADWLTYRAQRLVAGQALAPEFRPDQMSPEFRVNGNSMPASDAYRRMAEAQFASWRLRLDGLVTTPRPFGLDALRSLPSRTQITRHDCVEGWSAIGKWKGVQLSHLLTAAMLKPQARYVVLHCADDFGGTPYYESIDLDAAFHPQTILAYEMNDAPLSIGHGAPLRLRVERQLGYKQAKYVMRVEVVASLAGIGRGRGGFWEDAANYDWYAGI